MVGTTGLEPVSPKAADFKSASFTYSDTSPTLELKPAPFLPRCYAPPFTIISMPSLIPASFFGRAWD